MGQKLTDRTELAEAPASGDFLHVVDISDTTDSAEGTSKKITVENLTSSKMANPMTAGGDIIYGGASGVPTRLSNGTAGQVLQSNGTTVAPSWETIVTDPAAAIHAATEKTTPADADELGLIDSAASYVLKRLTWTNVKATLKTYLDTLYPPQNGWVSYSTVVPTRASADDPTYVLTFAGVDLTSTMSVGMKVKWTQNSTVRYGIITAIAFSTNTTLTLYGGTDYDVDDTAIYAISAFNYSTQKAPLGFPLDPTKWSVTTTDTSDRQQTSPVQNTWYNLGSINIVVPIGSWRTSYQCAPSPLYNANTSANQYVTLSTANNSESDSDFTVFSYSSGASGNIRHDMPIFKEKFLLLASKTTYYLNSKTDNTSQTQLNLRNSIQKTIIRAVCAYL